MVDLDICNASQSYYDIEGDHEKKLDELKLERYLPGEDVSACTTYAQNQFKVLQSGYDAPAFRSGSKLLLKFCNTECEQFHRNVYAKLDYLVKAFENKFKFKLADPKSITIAADYRLYLGTLTLH
jgi:hypothetical protein